MLHGVLLRSALAVAVSATGPPDTPAVVLDESSTPSQVPETWPELGLMEIEVACVAGDCATSCATTPRVAACGSTSDVLHVVPWLQKVRRCPEAASCSSMR